MAAAATTTNFVQLTGRRLSVEMDEGYTDFVFFSNLFNLLEDLYRQILKALNNY
jgi:hypothetical protein